MGSSKIKNMTTSTQTLTVLFDSKKMVAVKTKMTDEEIRKAFPKLHFNPEEENVRFLINRIGEILNELRDHFEKCLAFRVNTPLKWNGTLTELCELIFALFGYSDKNGEKLVTRADGSKASRQDIVKGFEAMLNVNLQGRKFDQYLSKALLRYKRKDDGLSALKELADYLYQEAKKQSDKTDGLRKKGITKKM